MATWASGPLKVDSSQQWRSGRWLPVACLRRHPWLRRKLAASVSIAALSFGAFTTPAAAATHSALRHYRAKVAPNTFSCSLVGKQMVVGTPDVAAASVPAIHSIGLVAHHGGLIVTYHFRPGFKPAPEGVYFAWSVYIYRHRADADNSTLAVQLQVQDRGKGWEPSGWSVLASTYYQTQPVAGKIGTDTAHDKLSVYFPPGFANLKPPFYWYASQVVFRSYLPRNSKKAHQDFSVNGSITNDCPDGVRTGTFSLPYPTKLLAAL